ncbi:MAG: head-tail connector protein [Clostridiales bacterium]|nr:head-tail connector protein [Clostridiales bacterium]
MAVTIEEARNYLRVDISDDDGLISALLNTAVQLCIDVARCKTSEELEESPLSKAAVLYTLGYLYEHREEADHHELTLTLRSLLFPLREGVV